MALKRRYVVVDRFISNEHGEVEVIAIKNRATNDNIAAAVRKVGDKDYLGMYSSVDHAREAHGKKIVHPVKETRPARDYPQFTGTSRGGGKKR